MSSTVFDTSDLATTDRERARRALAPAAVVTTGLAVFFALFRADSVAEGLGVIAFDVVVAGLLFGLGVSRALRRESAGGRAVTASVLGLLLILPAFWSGLPILLGAAGALIGYAGKRAATGSGASITALVVGLLAVAGYLAFYVSDWIANPGATWWA